MSEVVHELRQMLCDQSLSEGDRYYAADALAFLADDGQSIDLIIDAATDLHHSSAFRAAVKTRIVISVYGSILTRAQRKRLESVTYTSPTSSP